MIKIRPILKYEIDQLQGLPPEDWNLDLPQLFSFHLGHSYFYPAVAETDGKIMGCGIGMINGTVSWLGTIIVLPEYRRQGIGQAITEHLIEYCRSKGCTTQLLTASEMGEPLYRRLGFRTDSLYVFYKCETPHHFPDIPCVRKIQEQDFIPAKKLDREITCEDRFPYISRFFSTGWVYCANASSSIDGVFLSEMGQGFILARTPEAGIALMKLRVHLGKTSAVIPEANSIAKELLLAEGFQEYRRSPRMVLGRDLPWQPRMLYNRATGYCG
jgi:GNAT superfamily N-acetyltransferase